MNCMYNILDLLLQFTRGIRLTLSALDLQQSESEVRLSHFTYNIIAQSLTQSEQRLITIRFNRKTDREARLVPAT